MRSFLKYAFEQIEQLKFLYNTDILLIERSADVGMDKNLFARRTVEYLDIVLSGDDEALKSEEYLSL